MTPAEYLEFERRSEMRHEYDDGRVTPRARSNLRHNQITGNLAAEIRTRLKGRSREAYVVGMRVHVEATGLFAYPDAIISDGPRFLDAERDTLLNPVAIVEVFSPSTEAYDRGRKFGHYQRIPSLVEYVLIAQDRPVVERFTRRGDEWVLSTFRGLEDALALESAGVRVPLREVYDRVEFPPEDEAG